MSESQLYRLSQQLRLLAREGIRERGDGHAWAGELHFEVEAARTQLEEILDHLLDGHPLGELQQRHVRFCQELAERNRPRIRQLQMEFA